MCVLPVLLAAVLAAERDATSLVARLGSASEAERADVAARLDAMGLPAIEALRAAARDASPEVRRRASELLVTIENGLLVRPSLVTLGGQDQTITELIGSIKVQTGIVLALEPKGDPIWPELRIRLDESRALPFWEVLDRINTVARLHHNPAFARGPDERTPVFHLEEGARPFPKSVSGPFRVNLIGIRRSHSVVFEPADDAMADDPNTDRDPERFDVLVQVFAEPQLMVTLNGPVKELTARDDFDQDLAPSALAPDDDDAEGTEPPPRPAIQPGPGPVPGALSVVQFPIALHAPQRPGTTIARLEGVVPLQVAIRCPDPLVVRLAHVMGRSVGTDELSVRLPDQAALAPTPGSMTLRVRLQTRGNALLPEEAPAPQDFPEPRPVDTLQNRLEILDARQRPLAFRVVSAEVDDSGESLVVIRLSGCDASEKPDALRIFSLIMGAVEVPFRFSQLPIP